MAHALNKAALIASDCGLTELAHQLCWQHIHLYRDTSRPLTVLHARYMLEPVVNLARLQLRANDGQQALQLLASIYHAVTTNTDLVVEERTLPLAGLTGPRHEHHKLREWAWLHLIGDGIRALTLAGRWNDAVTHAHSHRGLGRHLMEGRQATIVAHCLNGAFTNARAALAESTPEHPWEHQVAACLQVMCSTAGKESASEDIATMIRHFTEQAPTPGYAVFRARLGLTVTTLTSTIDPDTANHLLARTAGEALKAGDGYAAREALRYRHTQTVKLATEHKYALSNLVTSSGLDQGTLPEHLLHSLLDSTETAAQALSASLQPSNRHPRFMHTVD